MVPAVPVAHAHIRAVAASPVPVRPVTTSDDIGGLEARPRQCVTARPLCRFVPHPICFHNCKHIQVNCRMVLRHVHRCRGNMRGSSRLRGDTVDRRVMFEDPEAMQRRIRDQKRQLKKLLAGDVWNYSLLCHDGCLCRMRDCLAPLLAGLQDGDTGALQHSRANGNEEPARGTEPGCTPSVRLSSDDHPAVQPDLESQQRVDTALPDDTEAQAGRQLSPAQDPTCVYTTVVLFASMTILALIAPSDLPGQGDETTEPQLAHPPSTPASHAVVAVDGPTDAVPQVCMVRWV